MPSKHLIYGLVDPRSDQLRYVGKSVSGLARPIAHAYPSILKANPGWRTNWIRQLQSLDLTYRIVVLQELDGPEILSQAEVFWIAYFRQLGCPLTNATAGGDGLTGYRPSEATRAKLSASHRGHKHSPETRAKMSAAKKGVPKTPAQRVATSVALMGHVVNAATRAKISATKRGL